MWVYGQTDLNDPALTLRQLWARFRALPPWAPVWAEIEAAQAKADEATTQRAVEDALSRYKPRG